MVLIAHRDAAGPKQPTEETLDFPAAFVAPENPPILSRRLYSVGLMRRNQFHVPFSQPGVQSIAVIGFVSNESSGKLTNEAGSQRFFNEGDFMWRSRGHKDGDRKTRAICHCHDLRTLAPLGISHSRPPFLAMTNVPSMKHSDRSRPPRSRTSWASRFKSLSRTPLRTQFWNRRWQVWYEGYRSGRSCQGAPVFKTHRMPLSTARVSFQGRPRPSGRHLGLGISGFRSVHCSSVRSIHSPPPPLYFTPVSRVGYL